MTRLKYFHDSLNIVVILAPGRKSFSANYAKFLIAFFKSILLSRNKFK